MIKTTLQLLWPMLLKLSAAVTLKTISSIEVLKIKVYSWVPVFIIPFTTPYPDHNVSFLNDFDYCLHYFYNFLYFIFVNSVISL